MNCDNVWINTTADEVFFLPESAGGRSQQPENILHGNVYDVKKDKIRPTTEHYERCPHCGKVFYVISNVDWGYKKNVRGKDYLFCSWTCLRNYARQHDKKVFEERQEQARRMRIKRVEEEERKMTQLRFRWERPDFDKETGERLGRKEIAQSIISCGLAKTFVEAEKYYNRHAKQEGYYQKNIMDAIRSRAEAEGRKCKIWKSAAGQYSQGGIPDVIGTVDGVFFAVEVKRPVKGVVSELQEQFIKEINECGGAAGVAIYPEDLDPIWDRMARIAAGRTLTEKGACDSDGATGT